MRTTGSTVWGTAAPSAAKRNEGDREAKTAEQSVCSFVVVFLLLCFVCLFLIEVDILIYIFYYFLLVCFYLVFIISLLVFSFAGDTTSVRGGCGGTER